MPRKTRLIRHKKVETPYPNDLVIIMEFTNGKANFSCKLGLLTRPDGSAVLNEGNTSVLAGVYGPVEVKLQRLLMDKASVECHYRPKSGLPGVRDRLYESVIRNICETSLLASLYPRTAILVTLQEIQDSGQLISCAVNAACLACLNAGIDMKFMFASVTCYLTVDEEITLTPPIMEKVNKATFVFVFDSSYGKIIASHTKGTFSEEQFNEAVKLSKEGTEDIFNFFKKAVQNSVKFFTK
ncbi:exosome complex component RRP46 [Diorhabda carinulata]|uniref:exosome complex component RRP46 n=1 Tax=Diorhabda carinulata TaxID=1163345 RepID=UPI0025A0F387|nr:exosome complex component RRP46 [Diorhabda carinulata]